MNMNRKNVFVKLLSIMLTVVMVLSVMPLNVIVGTAEPEPSSPTDPNTATATDGEPESPPNSVIYSFKVTDPAGETVAADAITVSADNGAEVTSAGETYTLKFADATTAVKVTVSDAKSDDDVEYQAAEATYDPAALPETSGNIQVGASYRVKVIYTNGVENVDTFKPYNTNYEIENKDCGTGYTAKSLKVKVGDNETTFTEGLNGQSVTVTAPVTAQFTYNKAVSVTIAEGKGSVILNGNQTFTESGNYSFSEPQVPCVIKPSKGYKIVSLTINGSSQSLQDGLFNGTISIPSDINVRFQAIKYKFTYHLRNETANGSYKFKVGDGDFNPVLTGSTTDPYVDVLPNDSGNHVISIAYQNVLPHYVLTIDGAEQKDGGLPKTSGTVNYTLTGNKEVTINLKPVEYNVTFIDPFADAVITAKGNVETASITPDRTGITVPAELTFKGWVLKGPDTDPANLPVADAKETVEGPFESDCTYYAVYTVNKTAEVTATSKAAYNGADVTATYKNGAGNDKISQEWFSGDVTLEIADPGVEDLNAIVTIGTNDPQKVTSCVIKANESEIKEYAVTVGFEKSYTFNKAGAEAVTFTYATEEAALDRFTVKIDTSAPTLNVKSESAGGVTDQQVTDTLTLSDQDTGSKTFSLAYVDLSNASDSVYKDLFTKRPKDLDYTSQQYKAYLAEMKSKLKDETWTDLSIDPGDTEATVNYAFDSGKIRVYRLLDKAGNVAYSAFDLTKPEIVDLSISYPQNGTTRSGASGTVYANGDVTVTAVVRDKRIAYVRDSAYQYDGASLVVTDSENNTHSFAATEVTKNFELFYDRFTCTFTIPSNQTALLENALTFVVNAEDQAGNKAETKSYEGEIHISKAAPVVAFSDYSVAPTNGYITTNENVNVTITVSGRYLDLNGLNNTNVVVKLGDDVLPDSAINWTKTATQWTGNLTVSVEDGQIMQKQLKVIATSDVGNTTAEVQSAVFNLDKQNPDIQVKYAYKTLDNTVSFDADGNVSLKDAASDNTAVFYANRGEGVQATITVKDVNLAHVKTNDNLYKVKLDGEIVKVTWDENKVGDAVAVLTFPADTVDTAHTLAVSATDKAGNTATYTDAAAHTDGTAPAVDSVVISIPNNNGFVKKVIHTLSGGVFFKENATVTVTAEDTDSKISSAAFYFNRLTGTVTQTEAGDETPVYTDGETEVMIEIPASGAVEQEGKLVFTFDLPYVTGADQLEYWKNQFAVAVCDNAGNTTGKVAYGKETEAVFAGEANSLILFETVAPVISSDSDGVWLAKDGHFKASVVDEDGSGLYAVRVWINDVLAPAYGYFVGPAKEKINSFDVEIPFDKFTSQAVNTVKITAVDVAGNEAAPAEYTVYCDNAAPTIKSVTFSGTENENIVSHGNYYNSDLTVTVAYEDAAGTSGLAAAYAEFVYDDNGETKTVALTRAETALPAASTDKAAVGIFTFTLKKDNPAHEKEGYIRITLKDNAGFITTVGDNGNSFASDTTSTNVLKNNVMIDRVAPVLSHGISIGDQYVDPVSKKVYFDSFEKVSLSVDASDDRAGLREFKLLLVDPDMNTVELQAVNENAARKLTESYNYTISDLLPAGYTAKDGLYTLKMQATDNAGNPIEKTINLYLDQTEPVVENVTMALDPDDASWWQKVIHFGKSVFFGQSVTVTFTANDALSGVKTVKLTATGYNTDTPADGTAAKTYTYDPVRRDGDVFTFELPYDELKYWNKELNFTVTDNLGHETVFTGTEENFGDFDETVVLYETVAPTLAEGENDKGTFHTEGTARWLNPGQVFNLAISDGENGSGLYSVKVKINGSDTEYDFSVSGAQDIPTVYEAAIKAESLSAGKNEITISAEDISGNQIDFDPIVIYYDADAPVINNLNVALGEDENLLKHGNYGNGGLTVTVDVSDVAPSSGFESVKVSFIPEEGDPVVLTTTSGADGATALDADKAQQLTFTAKAADLLGKKGTLQVVVTDNAGRTSVLDKNTVMGGADAPAANFTVNSFVFENSPAAISETHTQPDNVHPDKGDCYRSSNIEFTIQVNDATEDAKQVSGIRSIHTTLNGVDVTDATMTLSDSSMSSKSVKFNLSNIKDGALDVAKENDNVIVVTVVDNAGNESTETYTVYIDSAAPYVSAINLDVKDGSIRKYGSYFHTEATLTVAAKDDSGVLDSGVKEATLYYTDYTNGAAKEKSIVGSAEFDKDAGLYVITFKLPVNSADANLAAWKAGLKLSLTDKVGNDTDPIPLTSFKDAEKNVLNDTVLFETEAPSISSSASPKDKAVLYAANDEASSLWLKKNASFKVTVADDASGSDHLFDSGLSRIDVTVTDNTGKVTNVFSEKDLNADADNALYEWTNQIAYDKFAAGANTVSVVAFDNAGNRGEATYTVYTDKNDPQLTKITVDSEKGSNLDYGNFFNGDITVTLDLQDKQYSSGIASIDAVYVTESKEEHPLTEQKGTQPESDALTEGDTTLTRVFTLAEVEDTTGYLKITVTDNVGNTFVFNNNSGIPEGSNISNKNITFENAVSTITETHSEAVYVRGEADDCYAGTDIAYTITINDEVNGETKTDAVKTSGIRTVTTTLNGVKVESASETLAGKQTGKKTYTFNLKNIDSVQEGKNDIKVTTVDNAGNVNEAEYVVFVDKTEPEITSLKLAIEDRSEILRTLTLGNFFNGKVELTVEAVDSVGVCDTGVKTAILTYDDVTAEPAVTKTVETKAASFDEQTGVYTFKFELPLTADSEADIAYWKSILSIAVVDNVDNKTEDVRIAELGQEIESLASSDVLFEKQQPNISSSYDNKDGGADDKVLYFEGDDLTHWIYDGASFAIDVNDVNQEGYDSGLYNVTVTDNNKVIKKYGYQLDEANGIDYTYHVDFAYDQLDDGENVIVVSATDISGNTSEKTYHVFKDAVKPAVTGITVDAGEGSLREYGNFFNDGVTVKLSLRDSEFSSGISNIAAKYVADDGKEYALKETDAKSPESSPLKSGDTLIERTFTLDYVDSTEGYLEITVTDNVGNVSVFTKDSKIPENSNIKNTNITFEQAQLTLDVVSTEAQCVRKETVEAEDGSTHEVEKNCYMTDDVRFDLTVTDDAAKLSGIRTLTTTLNDVVVKNASADLSEEFVPTAAYSFNIGEVKDADENIVAVEGENVVKIVLTDNAGNTFTQIHYVYLDYTLPVITAVKMEKVQEGSVLNLLKFGNFFNDKVVMTVVATDKDSVCNTGVLSATLTYMDYTGENPVERTIENLSVTIDGENHIFTFELPIGYDEDAEEAMVHWKSILSIAICDGVGNKTDTVNIHALGNNVEAFESSSVLFETEKPNVSTSIDNGEKYDDGVLYFDENGTSTYWVRSGESFRIFVNDSNVDGYDSGLFSVEIRNNGSVYTQQAYGYRLLSGDEQTQVFDFSTAIAYNDLDEGLNNIRVTVLDNAGNRTSVPYVVYKDVDAPVITKITLTSEDSALLSYGCFFHDDLKVKVDVRDDVFTSGIATVNVDYVTTDGRVIALEEDKEQKKTPEAFAVTTEENNTLTRDFLLKLPDHTAGSLLITVIDNVGNKVVFDKDSAIPVGSNFRSTALMFETTALQFTETDAYGPVEVAPTDGTDPHRYVCADDEFTWYQNFNIDVDINVFEPQDAPFNSGVREVTTKLNDVTVDVASGTGISTNENVNTTNWKFNVGAVTDAAQKLVGQEGKNTITVDAVDEAGNRSSYLRDFYVDTTKPVVEGMLASGANGNESDESFAYPVQLKDANDQTYGFYFSSDTTITVYVSDAAPSSGLSVVHFAMIPIEEGSVPQLDISSAAVSTCAVSAENDGGKISRTATFVVPAGFKGQLNAYVEDNVGNVSAANVSDIKTWMHPDDFILETPQEHLAEGEHVFITPADTNFVRNLANGTPLYGNDATVSLEVSDHRAGIRSISCSVKSPFDVGNNASYDVIVSEPIGDSVAHRSDRTKEEIERSGWKVVKTDRNLVTVMTRTINVPNNSNDIEITLSMVDNSGNTSTKTFKLNVDKDAPVITVSYDLASEADDAEYTGYFNKDRLLTVTINERNFDPSLVNITAMQTGAAYSVGGFDGIGGVQTVENGIESYVYTLTHTFHADGDYTFAIEATDMANHQTIDDQVNYGAEADKIVAKTFTIDETLPVVRASISGEKGEGIYYNGNVLLTVTVEEHNFDRNRYVIEISTLDPQTSVVTESRIPMENFTEGGDTHTFTYDFSAENKFVVTSLKVTDKAGNVSVDDYEGRAIVTEGFIVDQDNPTIELFMSNGTTPLDHTATNAEDCGPVIYLHDTNLSHSFDFVTIRLYGMMHGSDLVASYATNVQDFHSVDAGTDYIKLRTFPHDPGTGENYDDIYQISVSVRDMAGRYSEATVGNALFSVNRFGSTFMVSDNTQKLLNQYYVNKDGIEDVDLIQVNASEVSEQKLTLQKDMESFELQKDVDYSLKPMLPGDAANESSWYEYDYTLFEKNFVQEARYAATVISKDQATNTSSNVTSQRTINLFTGAHDLTGKTLRYPELEQHLEAPVEFQVDLTPPIAYVVGHENNENVQKYTSTYEIDVKGEDAIMLDRVEVNLRKDAGDGAILQTAVFTAKEIEDNKSVLTVSEETYNKYQSIELIAFDKAGNQSAPYVVNVQVTQNIFRLFWGNTLAKIISASVLLVLFIFFIILLKRRKDKKDEAEGR